MSRVLWTQAIFRVLAIWLAIQILAGIPSVIANYVTFSGAPGVPFSPSAFAWSAALANGGFLAAAAVLWFGSGALASAVWTGIPTSTTDVMLSPVEFQRAVFAALGIYLLGLGLPAFIEPIRSYLLRPEGFTLEPQAAWIRQVEATGAVLQVIMGLWLLFGSRQLSTWLSQLREPRIDMSNGNG